MSGASAIAIARASATSRSSASGSSLAGAPLSDGLECTYGGITTDQWRGVELMEPSGGAHAIPSPKVEESRAGAARDRMPLPRRQP